MSTNVSKWIDVDLDKQDVNKTSFGIYIPSNTLKYQKYRFQVKVSKLICDKFAIREKTLFTCNTWGCVTYTWFPNKSLCSVMYIRWSYLHFKQIQISQDWSEIRESWEDQFL